MPVPFFYYAHRFNFKYKGPIDNISVGDGILTYIKIGGAYNYVWFYLSAKTRRVTAYHLADNRGTIPAVAATNEAIRTANKNQDITIVTDGNPSYIEAIQFLNKDRPKEHKIKHIQVIGLQNNYNDNDEASESEEYRPFKQMIERFNRSYKHHVRPTANTTPFPHNIVSIITIFTLSFPLVKPFLQETFFGLSILHGKCCEFQELKSPQKDISFCGGIIQNKRTMIVNTDTQI